MVTPKEMAMVAAQAMLDKLGQDVKLLQIEDITSLASHFLICTGTSNTHIKTLCDAVEKALDDIGEPKLRREGHRSGTWVLLDFGCLVVHVFTEETRKFYDLERLWSDGIEIDISELH